jgi:hypothetical protein
MKSLTAGFDVVSNHFSLILFSVLLDFLLWIGPHVRLMKVIEPIFREAAAIPEMQKSESLGLLRSGAERLNLLGVIRTFPVGIPSLMAGRSPLESPFSRLQILDVETFWHAAGLWLLFLLAGLAFGTLYFSLVAQATVLDKMNFRQALSSWPHNFGQVLLLTAFWYLLISIFLLPLSCLMSILLFVGIGVGQFPLLIALFFGGIVVWLLIPLFFSPHGIFTSRRPMWDSILQGIRLSRITFSTTGLLILSVVVISAGLDILWNMPKEDSWFLLVGIVGHAFVTAGLLAATFVYYRDADLWLKEIVRQKESNQTLL